MFGGSSGHLLPAHQRSVWQLPFDEEVLLGVDALTSKGKRWHPCRRRFRFSDSGITRSSNVRVGTPGHLLGFLRLPACQ